MKALIVDSGTRIAPFMDPVRESLFLFSSLGDFVDTSLREQGLNPVFSRRAGVLAQGSTDELILVMADSTFVSPRLLKDFMRDAKLGPPARLALRRSPSVDYLRPVSDTPLLPLEVNEYETSSSGRAKHERMAREKALYDVFLLRLADLPKELESTALLDALRKQCKPLVVAKREIVMPVRLPSIDPDKAQQLDFPVTASLAADVQHWVHILWLSHLSLGMYWMNQLQQHPLWMAGRALSAFPWRGPNVFKRLVRVGRGCRIHPTAHIELSVLGDGVVVGPHASIRNSFVGDGVEIGERATLLSSLVGANSFVTHKTFMLWSAAYPEATIGNYKLQVSLIGRAAHINPWAGLIDAKFLGEIKVARENELMSTERSFLGSCIGHRARMTAKVLIQPGRSIPNDTLVVMRPDEVIADLPKQLPQGEALVRDAGTLKPLKELLLSKNNEL